MNSTQIEDVVDLMNRLAGAEAERDQLKEQFAIIKGAHDRRCGDAVEIFNELEQIKSERDQLRARVEELTAIVANYHEAREHLFPEQKSALALREAKDRVVEAAKNMAGARGDVTPLVDALMASVDALTELEAQP